jgi:hypothetical protein
MYKFNQFILEKRISQISANIQVRFGFDLIKTGHSAERSILVNRNTGDSRIISDKEMEQFVEFFVNRIANAIVDNDIEDGSEFVIRSLSLRLSMALAAKRETDTYWVLIIKTIFPEEENNRMRIRHNQFVITKD